MIIYNYPLSWYVDKLKRNDYFSLGRYGDGAWIAMRGRSHGTVNAEGSVFTHAMGKALRSLLKYKAPNYYFSTPAVMNHRELHDLGKFASKVSSREFLDCDIPWDRECRLGGLVPFIKQIQKMKVCIISNPKLRELKFLGYEQFIEIKPRDCFDQIDYIMEQVEQIGGGYVYLISAGQPSPIIAQRIHARFPDVFALDVGSIWDAFLGIGGQRGWRSELYKDPAKYQAWKDLYKDVLNPDGDDVMSPKKEQDRVEHLYTLFQESGRIMYEVQRIIYNHIGQAVAGTVLDVGCGTGTGTAMISRTTSCDGADICEKNLEFARQIYPWLDFIPWDMEGEPLGRTYQHVVCVEAIEHVEDISKALRNLMGAATDRLWLSTPNHSQETPGNPYHVREYSVPEMLNLLSDAGAAHVTVRHWESFSVVEGDTTIDPIIYEVQPR